MFFLINGYTPLIYCFDFFFLKFSLHSTFVKKAILKFDIHPISFINCIPKVLVIGNILMSQLVFYLFNIGMTQLIYHLFNKKRRCIQNPCHVFDGALCDNSSRFLGSGCCCKELPG